MDGKTRGISTVCIKIRQRRSVALAERGVSGACSYLKNDEILFCYGLSDGQLRCDARYLA